MAVLAGIDEAGYGPLLGPLVVSMAVLRLPDELIDEDLWHVLAGAVRRTPSKRAGTLAVGDSKKLFKRKAPKALAHLERGVLAMLATRGVRPGSLRELLKVLCPRAVDEMAPYPWYAEADLPVPQCITATDVALAGNALSAALAKAGVQLAAMRSEVVLAGEFNRTVEATQNKSTTLFDVNSRLLVYLWQRAWQVGPPGAVRVHADRHGGRMRYRRPLQRVFDGCDLKILDENEALSGYRITDRRQRAAELYYGVDFDRRHLAVALASMVSKYLRELFMALLNRFWARQVEDLAPTAGYYVDGRRFLAEIAPAVRRLGVDTSLLQRSR